MTRFATVKDLVAGFVVLLLGGFVMVYTRTFPSLPGGRPGPALFPLIIGAVLALMGLILCLRTVAPLITRLRAGHRREAIGPKDSSKLGGMDATGVRLSWTKPVLVLLGIAFYYFSSNSLGFVLAMLIVFIVVSLSLKASVLLAILGSIISVVFVYFVFSSILQVPLPDGLLGLLTGGR